MHREPEVLVEVALLVLVGLVDLETREGLRRTRHERRVEGDAEHARLALGQARQARLLVVHGDLDVALDLHATVKVHGVLALRSRENDVLFARVQDVAVLHRRHGYDEEGVEGPHVLRDAVHRELAQRVPGRHLGQQPLQHLAVVSHVSLLAWNRHAFAIRDTLLAVELEGFVWVSVLPTVLKVCCYHGASPPLAGFAVHSNDILGVGLQPRMRVVAECDARLDRRRIVILEREVCHCHATPIRTVRRDTDGRSA